MVDELVPGGRVSVVVLRWSQVLDDDGTHLGWVATTRVGYFPCDLDRQMLTGAKTTHEEAARIVRGPR